MTLRKPEQIRNLALVGHAGAGKTTLIEALLLHAGEINQAGTIERGSTVSDFDPLEKEQQHSLDTAICQINHNQLHINLLDTPGYPDFAGRTISALAAVDAMAVVVNTQNGIESMTEKMLNVAAGRELCRMIIINKIDSDGNFEELLADIQQRFGAECLPLNLPSADGESVVDCFFQHGDADTAFSSVEETHTAMVDQVVEVDEELMQLYLEQGQELSPEQLHEPFEQCLREGHLIPVCFVSARTGAGLAELLEVFERLMPNPLEGNPPHFLRRDEDKATPVKITPDPKSHVIAHVFKVTVDPFVGVMGIFRVWQGTVTVGQSLYIGESRQFKISHLLSLQGKKYTEIHSAGPGNICAVTKVDDIHYDAVLHDSHDEDHLFLEPMPSPPPMHGIAIQTTRRGDEQKLSTALHKLAMEDPSLKVEFRASLNETVLYGSGDLHLRIVLEKMRQQHQLELETRPPSIAYRETISKPADGHYRHKKQTGGAGQFGEVMLKVEPLERGQGFEFVNKVVGGSIPTQFIPAVEKGVRQVLDEGVIAGYPLQDIRVIVHDGKHHSVDSKEIAFVTAGKKAFQDAITKANPIVLEPVVSTVINAPDSSIGDITGDLSSRHGMINGTQVLGNKVEISAQVPLSGLEGYQSRLNAMTGGEGNFTVEFSHYERVPDNIQQELVRGYKPRADDG